MGNNYDAFRSGFIDKDKILEYVSEEDIFQLVFDSELTEFEYLTSPFREDNTPGCWFEEDLNGRLKFIDYTRNPCRMDCFSAVQEFYKIPNFYQTLTFIKEKLIDDGKSSTKTLKKRVVKKKEKKSVEMLIQTRDFNEKDRDFWTKYHITKQNLISDGVFAIRTYMLKNTKSGDFIFRVTGLCYGYTDFVSGNKKLYRPHSKDKFKFISTCTKNDVGGVRDLDYEESKVLITKSYKDYRVLKNLGVNAVWFQSETSFPDVEVLEELLGTFKNIYVFFDNDKPGIIASESMVKILKANFKADIQNIRLEEGSKDPSDLIVNKGVEHLNNF